MAKVRRRVTEGRFKSRGGRRHRRGRKSEPEASESRLAVPDPVEQSLLTLDASRDFHSQDDEEKGWRDVVFGWFTKKNANTLASRLDPDEDGPDPVRDILSHPRGPARLDAFQRTLEGLEAGTQGHRGVAIAFHRELVGLAEQAKVDLSLLKSRVEACAKGLMAAQEHEVAGMLLARIGRRHQAAEMFVAAGAIEALERAHEEIEKRESGDRLTARLAYEKFEGLFLVGFRKEARAALAEACRLWPEHPVYAEILERFEMRLPKPDGVLLKAGADAILMRRKWPIRIGRDDKAALTLKSPLVSRQHLELTKARDGVRVLPVEVPAETVVNGTPLERAQDLRDGEGTIDIRGVLLHYVFDDDGLRLWAHHGAAPQLYVPFGQRFRVAVGAATLALEVDAENHLVLPPQEGVRLNNDPVRRATLLLHDDRLQKEGVTIEVHRP